MPKLELEIPELKDFKENLRLKACLNYVIKNFKEVEPILKEHWLKSEIKKIEKDKER